jgi:hypothetical protein
MSPKSKVSSVVVLALGAGLAAACGSNPISAGQDELQGQIDSGNGLCGAAACGPGQLCCAQACSSTPACLNVTRCPAGWEGACEVDGGASDAGTTDAGTTDGGDCCPANYDMYACTNPNGSQGLACHNPAMGCASSTTCGQGCDPVVTGRCGVSGSGLQWYTTCGAPVCQSPPDGGFVDAGLGCPPIGSACTTKGQTCGTASAANCDTTLVCDDHDPKGPSGSACPISTKKYKTGIDYVDDAELQQLHDEMLGVKLATYKYTGQVADPDPTHLGFIIEDNPQSLAVDRAHHRVDLYGYVSMVVATTQVQEKEIAELRKELEATRKAAASCRGR